MFGQDTRANRNMGDTSEFVPDPSKILGPIEEAILPLPPDDAKARMSALSAIVMFEKVLTQSDTSGSGRLVIPKVGFSCIGCCRLDG